VLSLLRQGAGNELNQPDASKCVAVDFGEGRTVKYLAAGSDHTCAILDNDRYVCLCMHK
jgi:hypothetical protein